MLGGHRHSEMVSRKSRYLAKQKVCDAISKPSCISGVPNSPTPSTQQKGWRISRQQTRDRPSLMTTSQQEQEPHSQPDPITTTPVPRAPPPVLAPGLAPGLAPPPSHDTPRPHPPPAWSTTPNDCWPDSSSQTASPIRRTPHPPPRPAPTPHPPAPAASTRPRPPPAPAAVAARTSSAP